MDNRPADAPLLGFCLAGYQRMDAEDGPSKEPNLRGAYNIAKSYYYYYCYYFVIIVVVIIMIIIFLTISLK